MRIDEITPDDCLSILNRVDRGELVSERIPINGATESRISFKGAWMEEIILAGKKPGVALHGRTGGVLVRRGYATSKKFAVDSNISLNFYWITEAGRVAAKALVEK